MSRPFKFRAWDKDTKCYFYDVAVYPYNVVGIQRHNIESEMLKAEYGATHWTELGENAIIEQYTGSKDKNGKEIYEGDILDTPGGRCLCVWNGDGWTYQFKVHRTDWFDIVKEFHKNSEVIGNIHENPELLGGEDGRDK